MVAQSWPLWSGTQKWWLNQTRGTLSWATVTLHFQKNETSTFRDRSRHGNANLNQSSLLHSYSCRLWPYLQLSTDATSGSAICFNHVLGKWCWQHSWPYSHYKKVIVEPRQEKGEDGICGIMRVGSRNSVAISGLSLHKNGAALADTSTPWETWKYRWVYGKNIPNKASPVTWLSKFLATGNAPSQTTRLLVKVPAMLYFSVNCPSMRKVMFSFNREPRVI